MTPEIPGVGKAISGHTSFTSFISTEEGFIAMAMHGVGLTLMPKKTGDRCELEFFTSWDLTLIWLKVKVHKFTSGNHIISVEQGQEEKGERGEVEKGNSIILIVALKLLRPVWAIGLRLALPWAVVESIGMRGHILVQWVVPGGIFKFKAIAFN
jgi:hypothetical protein